MPPNALNYVEQFSVKIFTYKLMLGMPNLSLSARELKAHFCSITFPAHLFNYIRIWSMAILTSRTETHLFFLALFSAAFHC